MASVTQEHMYPSIPVGASCTPYSCRRRPKRGTAMKIRHENAHGQDTSPLFALPAEIRTLIFEFLIRSGTIHIDTRPCESHETWSTLKRYKEFNTGTAEQYQFVDRPRKLTYSTCRMPHEWELRYATSKRPEEHLTSPMSEVELAYYNQKHHQCVAQALRDFATGDYKEGCSVFHPLNLKANGCTACQGQYKRWTDTYGQPPRGLKKLHASSGVDLSFLSSCRQIYKEAWHLPFLQYTFDFRSTEHLADFGLRSLYAHQRNLIHTIHLMDSGPPPPHSKPRGKIPFEFFPGLQNLRLSFCDYGAYHRNGRFPDLSHYSILIDSAQVKSVEVINSYGYEPYGDELRTENRVLSEWIEDILLRKIKVKR